MRLGFVGGGVRLGLLVGACGGVTACLSDVATVDCADENNAGRSECAGTTGSTASDSETTPPSGSASGVTTDSSSTGDTEPATSSSSTLPSTTGTGTGTETETGTETTEVGELPPAGLCEVDLSAPLVLNKSGARQTISNGLFEASFADDQGFMMTELRSRLGSRSGNLIYAGDQEERYVGVQIWQGTPDSMFSYDEDGAQSDFEAYELGPAALRVATTWDAGDLQSQASAPTKTLFTPDGRWIRSEEPLVTAEVGGGSWFNAYMSLSPSLFNEITSDTPDLTPTTIPRGGPSYQGLYPDGDGAAAMNFDSEDTMHFCVYDTSSNYAVGFGSSQAYFSSDDGAVTVGGPGTGMRAVRVLGVGATDPAIAMQYDVVRNGQPVMTAYHFPLFSMIWSDPDGDPCACIAAQFDAWATPPALVASAGGVVTNSFEGLDIEWDDRDSGVNHYAEYGGYYAVDLDGTSPVRVGVSSGAVPTLLLRLEDSTDADTVEPFTSTEGIELRLDGVRLDEGVHYAVQTTFSGGLYVFLGRELSDQSELEISF